MQESGDWTHINLSQETKNNLYLTPTGGQMSVVVNYLLHLTFPYFLDIKKAWVLIFLRWFFRTLVYQLLGLLALQIKLLSLPQHLVTRLIEFGYSLTQKCPTRNLSITLSSKKSANNLEVSEKETITWNLQCCVTLLMIIII